MKNKTFACTAAPLLMAIALTACTPASATEVGGIDNSIQEVALALQSDDMRQVITDTAQELRDAATEFGTTFEFERDVLVCEQLHPTALDETDPNYETDPEAIPLSDCINGTIASHDMMED